MNHRQRLTVKIWLLTLTGILGTVLWFVQGRGFWEYILISWVLGYLVSIWGTMASHRWLSHRSFTPRPWARWLMFLGMIVESFGRPSHLVAAHRLHHRYTDSDGDPHSPRHHSFWSLWQGHYTPITHLPQMRDFLREPGLRWFDQHYWLLWWSFNLVLALYDWQLALIFCPVIFARSWFLGTVINYWGHGGTDCEPRNLHWTLVLLTGGEGLHKGHHSDPGNIRFGDWDFTGWLVRHVASGGQRVR